MLAINFFRRPSARIFSLGLALVMAGCFFGSEDKGGTGPAPGPTTCPDNLTAAQERAGDSIVAIAAGLQGKDLVFLFDTLFQSGFDTANWTQAKARDYQRVLDLYNQALAAAPGHCGALFGRALANMTLVIKDPALDAFIANMNLDPQVRGATTLFKVAPDQAAPILLKTSARMRAMDRTTIQEIQDLVGNSVLPRLDTALVDLNRVMQYPKFTFTFRFFTNTLTRVDTNTVMFDHALLGPTLGAFKVAKSVLLMVAGYDWEIALSGSYAWLDTLSNISDVDLDSLRPGQTAALDQFTGLFQTTSSFSRLKPAYAAQVHGIPALLLEAVNNAQDGLTYALNNHPADCTYRRLCVGSGVTDRVDSVDAVDMIDVLERSKKYLTGEVPVSYNHGTETLRVNFSRVFYWDGLQNFLPRFQFNTPYSVWNDSLGTRIDTSWGYFDPYYDLQYLSLPVLGYSQQDYGLYSTYDSSSQTLHFLAYDSTGLGFDTLANAMLTGIPCQIQYQKMYDRIYDSIMSTFNSVPNASNGTAMLAGCRDNGGSMQVVYGVRTVTVVKGPANFTDPSGNVTMTFNDFNDSVGNGIKPQDLYHRIYFRDPTFGGVFPGLTNDNIWATIASLDSVQDRAKICVPNPLYPWVDTCTWQKPANPSDLDLFVWVMHQIDQNSRRLFHVPAAASVIQPLAKKR